MKKLITGIGKFLKPLPGTSIGSQIKEVKQAWNEGKKVKAIGNISLYVIGAAIVWYAISKGIVTTLDDLIELVKVFV